MRPAVRFGLRVIGIGVAYGGLNLLASEVPVFPGVSMVYPASAVGVAVALRWRYETALAVFVATALTPWSHDNPFWIMLLYALGNSVEAVLPALILRPRRAASDLVALARLGLWACLVNTLANVVIARGPKVLAGLKPLDVASLDAAMAWWTADAVAVAIFALPLLLWLRPDLFFTDRRMVDWGFLRRRGLVTTAVLLTAAVSVAIYAHDAFIGGTFNWPVLLYLMPLSLLLLEGGLPGAAVGNAMAALGYLVTLGFEARTAGFNPLTNPEQVIVVYGNLAVLFFFAVVAGTIRTRNLELLRRLQQRWQRLKESFETTVTALAAAVEAKDATTEEHVARVSLLTTELARELGLDEVQTDLVRYAAILHDVGKIGVPAEILNKPGPLTPEEHEVMERHLDIGARILRRTGMLEETVPMVQYHEERWDGRTDGPYPARYGLRGEAIPLGARIIAVADAFDAMTSDRPYRRAMPVDDALAELRREAGRQFDPEVVRSFLRVLRRRGLTAGDSSGWVVAANRSDAAGEAPPDGV